jgi:hypothetical protein
MQVAAVPFLATFESYGVQILVSSRANRTAIHRASVIILVHRIGKHTSLRAATAAGPSPTLSWQS